MSEAQCQTDVVSDGSLRANYLARLAYRIEWHMTNEGFRVTFLRAFMAGLRRLHLVPRNSHPLLAAPIDRNDEILDLHPGDFVQVKSEEEIRRTLNRHGKQRGLFFAEGMRRYCNKRMRVLRRVERICLENQPGEVRKIRHTVLLDGAVCDGQMFRCDRMCPYMWREIWLRRVEPDHAASTPIPLPPPILPA